MMRALLIACLAMLPQLAAAGGPYRHYRLDNVGGACVSTGGSTITTVSASPPAIQTAATTTQPFLTAPAANTCIVGVHGVYGAAAIDNLVQRSSFETWAAGRATGWLPYGAATSTFAEETTHVAHGLSAGLMTTKSGEAMWVSSNVCNTDLTSYGRLTGYAKNTGGTTANCTYQIIEFDAANCTTYLDAQMETGGYGDVPSTWNKREIEIDPGNWNASTSSWLVRYRCNDAGHDQTVVIDAVQLRMQAGSLPAKTDAYCGCDTDATCSCSASIHSIPSPISANGTVQIDGTFRTPWSGTGLGGSYYLFRDGSGANSYLLYVGAGSDEPSFTVYDPSSDWKAVGSNVANWAANTDYTLKASKTPGGAMRLYWNSAWNTTTAGTGTGMRNARATTSAICNNGSVGYDCWVRDLKFFRRLVGQ